MLEVASDLTGKQQRIINRCLDEFFSARALDSVESFIAAKPSAQALLRLVRTSPSDGGMHPLSEAGLSAHDRIVDVVADARVFGNRVVRSDIWSAVRGTLEWCLGRRLRPDNASELVGMLRERIEPKIEARTFAVPFHGVQLDGVEKVQLGSIRIVKSLAACLMEEGISLSREDKPLLSKALDAGCIVGTFNGTPDAARRDFTEQVELAIGLLAVWASSRYEFGATQFCFRTSVDALNSIGGAAYVHWDAEKSIGYGLSFGRGTACKLGPSEAAELTEPGPYLHGFGVLQRAERCDIEHAVARAVYWYADAQRDAVRVMQFVKYWSCIEAFFSDAESDITESVSSGLVAVLTYGHFRYLKVEEYGRNKAAVKKLYAKRSRAVHGASHSHITGNEVVVLSQWTAWLIENAISIAQGGTTTRRALLMKVRELDELHAVKAKRGNI